MNPRINPVLTRAFDAVQSREYGGDEETDVSNVAAQSSNGKK
jgi:hypothetical protein